MKYQENSLVQQPLPSCVSHTMLPLLWCSLNLTGSGRGLDDIDTPFRTEIQSLIFNTFINYASLH